MKGITLDHWYVEENELRISLMRFYVQIKVLKNEKTVYYQLFVKDSDDRELTINFYALEDAISFTEQVVNKSEDSNEVLEKYTLMFGSDIFYSPFPKTKNAETSIIELTIDEVDEAIVGYFGKGKNYRVSSEQEVSLYNNQIDLRFYLIEHLDYDGIKKDNKIMLTESDLKAALNHYINFYNYKLIDFKYIGGIHRVGYYFDEDTPHCDGIQLKVKPNERNKVLSKSKK